MEAGERAPGVEELLASADWVRRIARRLVDDPERAADVAQDALAIALERRPSTDADAARSRRWLGGVVRHLAARGRRERERPAREREAGLGRVLAPPVDETLARLELHRTLTAAVLALDEPYRSTVALRYFDGLAPRAIAARQGVAGATVRKRLERAHALLRAKLDRSFAGGRGAWCAVLAPLARTGSIAAASWTGAVLVGTKAVIGVVVVGLGLAAWFVLTRVEREAVPSSGESAADALASSAPAEADTHAVRVPLADSVEREARSAPAQVAWSVHVRSLEERAAIPGALVLALDEGGAIVRARSDEAGRAMLPSGFEPVRIAACAAGHAAAAREVEGEPPLELELRREAVLSGVVLVDELPPGAPLELSIQTSRGVGDLELLAPFDAELRRERGHANFATDARGAFELRGLDPAWSGSLELPRELRVRSTRPAIAVSELERLELRAPVAGLVIEATRLPLLRGRIVDGTSGEPVSNARLGAIVEFEGDDLRTAGISAKAGPDGRFAAPLAPWRRSELERWLDRARRATVARIEVTVSGDGSTTAARFAFDARELADPLDLGDLRVTRDARLHLRVVDAASGPIVGARVFGLGHASEPTDARGCTQITGLPDGPISLTSVAAGHEMLEVELGAERGSESDPVELRLAVAGMIEIVVVDPDGLASKGLQLVVVLPIDGFGVDSERLGARAFEIVTGPLNGRGWSSEGLELSLEANESGCWTVCGLRAGVSGTLRIVDVLGQPAVERSFVAPPPGERTVMRIEARSPMAELRGRVVDEAGVPLAGARVHVRSEQGGRLLDTDANGAFVLGGLLSDLESTLAVEASFAERVSARIEGVRAATPSVPLELVLEVGRPFEVELVEENGGPAPVKKLAAVRAGIQTTYARVAGDGHFTFERLPAGEVELVTNVGGRVHRFRARVDDERARFTLPDHGALELDLGPGLPDAPELRARVRLPGVADYEHLAELDGPIALLPGSYLLELVHVRWIDGERQLLVLDGPRAVEIRAGETARVRVRE